MFVVESHNLHIGFTLKLETWICLICLSCRSLVNKVASNSQAVATMIASGVLRRY